MILKTFIYFLFFAAGLGFLYAQPSGSLGSSTGVSLTGPQWEKVVSEFEESVLGQIRHMDSLQNDIKSLQSEIKELEGKIALLRQASQKESSVIDEIRLKSLLNNLKNKLEKNASLQHEWDDRVRDFDQKALSLIALYNDRIDTDLGATNAPLDPSQLQLQFNELSLVVQKRNKIQSLLKNYQKKNDSDKSLYVNSFANLNPGDPDSLLLTLDLIRDRKKELEEQLEKWSIEEEEIRNELKLQEKMQEFLEDIQRMNEDSSFPRDSLKRNDLEVMAGNKERKQLEARLADLQKNAIRDQVTLDQLNLLMSKIQKQAGSRSGGGSP